MGYRHYVVEEYTVVRCYQSSKNNNNQSSTKQITKVVRQQQVSAISVWFVEILLLFQSKNSLCIAPDVNHNC